MRWILGAITVVCLFGSLSRLTPNVMWNDPTYFFRQNKSGYLKFSNTFRGTYLLMIGSVSLLLFLLSFFMTIPLTDGSLFLIFLMCVLVGRLALEWKWRRLKE